MISFVFVLMLACHVLADISLQGILANMKQKKWWEDSVKKALGKDIKETVYADDYYAALAMHAIEWAVVSQLPLLLISQDEEHLVAFAKLAVCNAMLHGVIDHVKANVFAINLLEDQGLHILQLFATLGIYAIFY